MIRTSLDSRLVQTVAAVVTTTAYYAVPDVFTSRASRGLAKCGCLAVATGASVAAFRQSKREAPAEALSEKLRPEEFVPVEALLEKAAPNAGSDAGPKAHAGAGRAGMAGLAAGGLAVSVGAIAASVAIERRIFRAGERRAAAGRRLPHTRAALVYGALSGALTWAMESDDAARAEQ